MLICLTFPSLIRRTYETRSIEILSQQNMATTTQISKATLPASVINGSSRLPPKKEDQQQELRRAYSEMASNLEKLVIVPGNEEASSEASSETTAARCACCGVSEECTAAYVGRVRAAFCGDWLCGLCGEAVKERMLADGVRVEAALAAHEEECREFNATTRLNPALSLAGSMRGIARRSFDRRRAGASASCQDRSLRTAASRAVALARSASCDPRFLLLAAGDDDDDINGPAVLTRQSNAVFGPWAAASRN